ncbi:hypothetical protein V8F33_002018 [Rhypophila sp. PSN 637]
MNTPHLPIEQLQAWAWLNSISFADTNVQRIPQTSKGFGLISNKNHCDLPDDESSRALLTVPHDLVLNAAAVKEYAKEDQGFRVLFDAVLPIKPRFTVLLFLLVQTALARREDSSSFGVSNPWKQYIKFLPKQSELLVPTLWNEQERDLLRGTSLESALEAKIRTLRREFDKVRQVSSGIPCWDELLWEHETVEFRDWIFLDAVYRSRTLGLPRSGESMVPCLDMANHAEPANAYYNENDQDEVVLYQFAGVDISEGEEVTISYGADKSSAEMLYTYGFLDALWLPPKETFDFPFDPAFFECPLTKAKMAAFGEPPKIHLEYDRHAGEITPDLVRWECPFAYLMCLNEEDGLKFDTLQETDGKRELRVKFQGEDVTERAKDFETLIMDHDNRQLFRYRVVMTVEHCLSVEYEKNCGQKESWSCGQKESQSLGPAPDVRVECLDSARVLRERQRQILEAVLEKLHAEVSNQNTLELFGRNLN